MIPKVVPPNATLVGARIRDFTNAMWKEIFDRLKEKTFPVKQLKREERVYYPGDGRTIVPALIFTPNGASFSFGGTAYQYQSVQQPINPLVQEFESVYSLGDRLTPKRLKHDSLKSQLQILDAWAEDLKYEIELEDFWEKYIEAESAPHEPAILDDSPLDVDERARIELALNRIELRLGELVELSATDQREVRAELELLRSKASVASKRDWYTYAVGAVVLIAKGLLGGTAAGFARWAFGLLESALSDQPIDVQNLN